jgi:hypothetical protein
MKVLHHDDDHNDKSQRSKRKRSQKRQSEGTLMKNSDGKAKDSNRKKKTTKGIESTSVSIVSPITRTTSMSTSMSTTMSTTMSWNANDYSYPVDYNDHFETPIQAYRDIVPLLNALKQQRQHEKQKPILYDPYYCNGQTKRHLQSLGFDQVYHEKRDFYQDIQQNTIPTDYDIFLTNPPYSDNHKVRCLKFCVQQWQQQKQHSSTQAKSRRRPFFLLMPCYVATKNYYKQLILSNNNMSKDMVYVVPHIPYQYHHPEGTGHDTSPFITMWFACVGQDRMEQIKQAMVNDTDATSTSTSTLTTTGTTTTTATCTLYTSYQQLITAKIIVPPDYIRPNPRQRNKRKMNTTKIQYNNTNNNNTNNNSNEIMPHHPTSNNNSSDKNNNNNKASTRSTKGPVTNYKTTTTTMSTTTMMMIPPSNHHKSTNASKYRDIATGKRTKKRF